MTFEEKIHSFAERFQSEAIQELHQMNLDCEANIRDAKTAVLEGKKYDKVNIGGSGRYMVDKETEVIYGIKGYGVINKKRSFGTLDTIDEYFWGRYHAIKKAIDSLAN